MIDPRSTLSATPSINDSGTVAFEYGFVVYSRSAGGPLITIAGPPLVINGSPSINASGMVAFEGIASGVPGTIHAGNGGPLIDIGNGSSTNPRINASGTVAFLTGVSIVTGNGGPPTTIADTNGQFSGFDPFLSINDNGIVVFKASLKSGGNAIFASDGSSISTIATDSGPFEYVSRPSINASGTVSYFAQTATQSGIFIGPDPVADKVIVTGDPLFGSIATGISYASGNGGDINGSGSVVFKYTLANGTSGIAVASVPEPSAFILAALGLAGLIGWPFANAVRQTNS
jgi:hypothetical protein